jgi:DNA-binding response OmpR family regulator
MHGFECLRAMKTNPETAGIPVLVLSNLGQDHDRLQTLQAGAAEYLVKANLSLAELCAAVDRVLRVPRR